MDLSLAGPVALLAAIAWAVPWGLSHLLPQTGRGVLATLALSVLLVGVAGAWVFAWLYGDAAEVVRAAAPWHFASLSAKAAIIWGPIVVLTATRRGA